MTTQNTRVDSLLRGIGTDAEIAKMIGEKSHVPRDWRRRGSIPVSRWSSLYPLGVTSEQLLAAHQASEAA